MGSTKKRVRWSTVTVYEFGVAIGGSAVPKRGGPAVGLAKTPEFVWSARVDAVDASSDAETDAAATTSSSSDSGDDDEEEELKASTVTKSKCTSSHSAVAVNGNDRCLRLARRRRVRWLKPIERVTMLEQAGCSEKRIYRMMMESSEIAMSRRLCISTQRSVTV